MKEENKKTNATNNTNTKKEEGKNMNETKKSIISVTVNGMTASESIQKVKSRLESIEKSAFNIALLCAYGTGVTIPAYIDNTGNEHGGATCEKPLKQTDYIKLVGRSKATVSRWITAMKLIIENGYFTDFSMGIYPFSFDKIIDIFSNPEVFSGYVLSDLMELSASTISKMVDDYKPEKTDDENADAGTDNDENADNTDDDNTTTSTTDNEVIELSYNNITYKVYKIAFEKFLSENAISE